jgi:tetratricopeptide (TPR) repeat protein
MHAWASMGASSEAILTRTFCLGLSALAAPRKWTSESQTKVETHVLAHLQAVALQWARLAISQQPTSTFPTMLATSWASQTALWQLQWLPHNDQRSLILPRLAESMAQRLIKQGDEQSQSAEIRLLSLRTLEHQSKWSEMLEILEQLPTPSSEEQQQPPTMSSEFGVALTTYQILTEKARVLRQLERYDAAQSVYESLLSTSPDDWSCWKGHLECCIADDKIDVLKSLVKKVLTQQADAKYPLRGPQLMIVELAAHMVRSNASDESLRGLATAIQSYSELFASRAASAFSDLQAYLELLLDTKLAASKEVAESLLEFSDSMRKANSSPKEGQDINNKERQSRLRAYILATKINHKLLAVHLDLQDRWLPDWPELVTEWQATLSMSSSNEGEAVGTRFHVWCQCFRQNCAWTLCLNTSSNTFSCIEFSFIESERVQTW